MLSLLGGSAEAAKIRGTVTSAPDDVALPGVEINLLDANDLQAVATVFSDDLGNYEMLDLGPGGYRLTAHLPGFADFMKDGVDLTRGAVLDIDIELEVASPDQEIEVIGERQARVQTASSASRMAGGMVDLIPVRGDDFRDLLPLLPGVVRSTDGRIVMKGAGATQASLVVNSSTNATDPATGNLGFNLPSDAIAEIEVMPNPYAAEFGRFSSGITNILTRQGTPEWEFTINNFLPRPKIRDGSVMGIGGFTPRLAARGPLVQDRVFLAQTFQYRYVRSRVPGQPDLRNDKHLESFDSFSQVDAILNSRHNLTAAVSVFPRKFDFINMDTFNPREVTANLHQRGYSVGLAERATLSATALLESTFSFKRFDVDIFGQGSEEMSLTPEGNEGSFFNLQERQTRTWQLVENLTLSREGHGDHLFKIGVDVLHSSFDGWSESRPVNIARADGSLSQRIEFSGISSQRNRSTDLALYGQDCWKVGDRLLFELGLRLDRDGVLRRTHVAPRLGLVAAIFPDQSGVLRTGAGFFYDRTPLNIGAFKSYESRRVTRFAVDGTTPIETTDLVHENAADLDTPYSFTWNVEYDQKVGESWVLKANYLRRNGFREFLIDVSNQPEPALVLNSRGRSRYWELELTGRYILNQDSFFMLSYVRSRAWRDLNGYDDFFGNIRRPVIRPNEFSLAATDAPHRFLFQSTYVTRWDWIIASIVEVRNGFPYSLINEDQEFVGPRNQAGRFPWLTTLDLDFQRWFKIWKWNTRIGFRLFNVFNAFNPRDFQSNIDSQNFGVFSNERGRFFGVTFQIEN